MPLVGIKEILVHARQRQYGVPSLLAGNLDMVTGMIKAAEEVRSPLILAFNRQMTPTIPATLSLPMSVRAAQQAGVPVAVFLDHGHDLEEVVQAIHLGASAVMFDGSRLDYEENVRQTREVVRVAHAVGVDVEAELGAIGGSAAETGRIDETVEDQDAHPERYFTDPELAAEFVERTGVDVLAVSFGNVHGVYRGKPRLDLERVRRIHARVLVPLAAHGASGLAEEVYPQLIQSGISKVGYYTAMGMVVARQLKYMLAEADDSVLAYHQIIAASVAAFYTETKWLLQLLGCAGKADLA